MPHNDQEKSLKSFRDLDSVFASVIKVPAGVSLKPGPDFAINTLILRPVTHYDDGRTVLGEIEFAQMESGYKMFKADRFAGNPICYYTDHWIVTKPSISKAMVCFCSEEIPSDWIAFKVIAKSRNGNALFCQPVPGSLADLLEYYNLPHTDQENTDLVNDDETSPASSDYTVLDAASLQDTPLVKTVSADETVSSGAADSQDDAATEEGEDTDEETYQKD